METREWYSEYYERKGAERNSLLKNPGVLFQTLAHDISIINAIRSIDVDFTGCQVLDIGCGNGDGLVNYLRLGLKPMNLFGIDILEERIREAEEKYPNAHWICGDARNMDFLDEEFDLVFESTMFVQIVDHDLSREIAEEMIRVVRMGGYIILTDWRYSYPMRSEYNGLSQKRIIQLFRVGTTTEVCSISNGALVPPVGRFLSARCPQIYFVICRVFPFLVGQQTTALRRVS